MSYPFKTILCPVDFDDNSLAALALATRVAAEHESTLYLLHVVPIIATLGSSVSAYSTHGPVQEAARKKLESIAGESLGKVKHEVALRVAPVAETAEAVIEAAEELRPDLIVMATHGRSGLSHLLLGSVVEKVVRRAPCPVLTVRPSGQEMIGTA